MSPSSLRERIEAVRDRLERAAARAGRDPKGITLVGISKTRPLDVVLEAVACGLTELGENRVQEATQKFAEGAPAGATLHLVGHLQKNKSGAAVGLFDVIHSVDSPALAARIGRQAGEAGKQLSVFVQVDLAGEATKQGVRESGLDAVLDEVRSHGALELAGLMILPPWAAKAEEVRPWFARLRELASTRGLKGLSMGMSHDFEVAIEEGATHVRVGEAIFGPRGGGPA